MIYLIGGAPRCGKTNLAYKLAEKVHYPLLITDTLQKAMRPYIPVEEHATLLPFHHFEEASHYNNDSMYSQHDADELVQAYITQAETYWRGFEKLIRHCLDSEQPYIIEGHVLHPAFISQLRVTNGSLKSIFLYKESVSEIATAMQQFPSPHDWVIERTHTPETYMKIATVIQRYGLYLKNEAKKYGFPSYTMDDFETSLALALDSL